MKKVLAIAPYPYLPYYSGGQKFIAQFLEHLGRQTALGVVGSNGNDWSLSRYYTFFPLLRRSFTRYFDPSLANKITEIVRKNGYDTVIWEHPYYAWLARRVKKNTGTRMILHTHNIEFQRFRSLGRWWWRILRRYEKNAFKHADHIFFITPEDRQWAIDNWKVDPDKCSELPFGVESSQFPADRYAGREFIMRKHGIASNEKILLFNGLLNYQPNIEALEAILEKINPILQRDPSFNYKIIVCGKGLPDRYDGLNGFRNQKVIYAGFVEDIVPYFKAADVFLNPVQSGGGIKTKMVEAIGYGATVVATESGSIGINENVCGDKLVKVADHDWNEFAKAVKYGTVLNARTPDQYYQHYNWENVIRNILPTL